MARARDRGQERLHAQLKGGGTRPQFIHLDPGADGRPLVSNRQYPAPADINLSDRPYFKWHRDKRGGLYVSEPLVGRTSGAQFFDMSRGRYLADGSFAGMVSVSLLPSYFLNFHKDLAADEPGLAITMLREDGPSSRGGRRADGPPGCQPPARDDRIAARETGGNRKGFSVDAASAC